MARKMSKASAAVTATLAQAADTAVQEKKVKRKKDEAAVDPLARFRATVSLVRQNYGDSRLRSADDFPDMERIPCGIFGLDLALGASSGAIGFARGRIHLLAGTESACKTLICLWLIREFQNLGEPTLYVSTEEWSKEWAAFNGVDLKRLLVQPSENAEQALDILAEFIRAMPNGLIVVDSFAQLTPTDEIEKSFEEWQQGLMARLANKGFRSMQSGQNSAGNEFLTAGPTIVIVQQFRSSISTGSGKVMPGGQGQLFAGSTITHLRPGAKIWYYQATEKDGTVRGVESSDGSVPKSKDAYIIGRVFHYDINKNKTSSPHRFGEFKFYTTAVKDDTGFDVKAATTNHHQQVVHAGVRCGVITRNGAYYSMGERKLGQGVEAAARALATDADLYDLIYDGVIVANSTEAK